MAIGGDQVRTLRDQDVPIVSTPSQVQAALNALEQAGDTDDFVYKALTDLVTLYQRNNQVTTSLTTIADQIDSDAATISTLQAQDANQNQIKVDQVVAFLNTITTNLNQIDTQHTDAIQSVVQDIANALATVE